MGAISDRIGLDISEMKKALGVDGKLQDIRFDAALAGALALADTFCDNKFQDDDGNDLPIPDSVKIWVQSIVAREIGTGINGTTAQTLSQMGTIHIGKRDMWMLAATWNPGVG